MSFIRSPDRNISEIPTNPYYEANDSFVDTLTEDCFIEQTYDNWYFGEDDSGNIQQPNFYESFKKQFESRLIGDESSSPPNKSPGASEFKVHLVTGDGGIRNMEHPELQEINSFNLILNEALVAINCLSENGCLVLKIFGFINCRTISLIYLLVCLFEQVDLFKPVSSNEGNNEIYLVCLNYQLNKNRRLVEQITNRFNKSKGSESEMDAVLLKKEIIPSTFLVKLIECASMFANHQIYSIERNIYLMEKNDKSFFFKYKKLQNQINKHYKSVVQLKPIKIEDQVVKKENQISSKKDYRYFGINKKALSSYGIATSYTEMIDELKNPAKQLLKIDQIINSVYSISKQELFNIFNKLHHFDHCLSSDKILDLKQYVVQPKRISHSTAKKYSNSKFCCEGLIKMFGDFEKLKPPAKQDSEEILRKEVEHCKDSISNQFRSLLSSSEIGEVVDHLQPDLQPHSLSTILSRVIKDLNKTHSASKKSTLHLFDLFSIRDELIRNDEHSIVNYLFLKLNEIVDQLKFNHTVVISLPSLHSRYAFGLIYLFSCIYKQFSISPFYLKSNDTKSGLVFIFTNKSTNGHLSTGLNEAMQCDAGGASSNRLSKSA